MRRARGKEANVGARNAGGCSSHRTCGLRFSHTGAYSDSRTQPEHANGNSYG